MRVTFQLEGDEAKAFEELCSIELRLPGQMANYLVIQELRERNLINKAKAERKTRETKKEDKEVSKLREEVKRLRAQRTIFEEEIKSLRATPRLDVHFQAYSDNVKKLFQTFSGQLILLAGQLNELRKEKGLDEFDYTTQFIADIKANYPLVLREKENDVPTPTS